MFSPDENAIKEDLQLLLQSSSHNKHAIKDVAVRIAKQHSTAVQALDTLLCLYPVEKEGAVPLYYVYLKKARKHILAHFNFYHSENDNIMLILYALLVHNPRRPSHYNTLLGKIAQTYAHTCESHLYAEFLQDPVIAKKLPALFTQGTDTTDYIDLNDVHTPALAATLLTTTSAEVDTMTPQQFNTLASVYYRYEHNPPSDVVAAQYETHRLHCPTRHFLADIVSVTNSKSVYRALLAFFKDKPRVVHAEYTVSEQLKYAFLHEILDHPTFDQTCVDLVQLLVSWDIIRVPKHDFTFWRALIHLPPHCSERLAKILPTCIGSGQYFIDTIRQTHATLADKYL